eukprot:TRINITY_DN42862_c0_g1_i1.p1 TRINITY_DN42862_c0_g1~~TRINITY_DN42862_c0_g1_i1.p1  ORF type:complete len:497 (+),score=109.34 TRINITY_DN42862_c0_g1_i1:75-1493(+)
MELVEKQKQAMWKRMGKRLLSNPPPSTPPDSHHFDALRVPLGVYLAGRAVAGVRSSPPLGDLVLSPREGGGCGTPARPSTSLRSQSTPLPSGKGMASGWGSPHSPRGGARGGDVSSVFSLPVTPLGAGVRQSCWSVGPANSTAMASPRSPPALRGFDGMQRGMASPRRRVSRKAVEEEVETPVEPSEPPSGLQAGMIVASVDGEVLDVRRQNHCRELLSGRQGEEVAVVAYTPALRRSDDLIPQQHTPLCTSRGLEAAKAILGTFLYTTEGATFDVDKKRPLSDICATASQILRDGVYIQCVEGTFVGLLLTHHLLSVVRFSISFQSHTPEGTVYKHLVLGVRHCKKYGVLGISRGKGLMSKDVVFPSLGALVADLIYHYTLEGHTVQKVLLSRPITRVENARPDWKAGRFDKVDTTPWEETEKRLKTFELTWVAESQAAKPATSSPTARLTPCVTSAKRNAGRLRQPSVFV